MKTVHIEDLDGQNGNEVHREYMGQSGETKPTGTFEGIPIRTGDAFIEMNTGDVYFYDENAAVGSEWVKFGG